MNPTRTVRQVGFWDVGFDHSIGTSKLADEASPEVLAQETVAQEIPAPGADESRSVQRYSTGECDGGSNHQVPTSR